MNNLDDLRLGMAQISELLERHGFRRDSATAEDGRVIGRFENGHRSIEFVVGDELESVRYRFGGSEVDHRRYMEELGVTKQAQLLSNGGETVEAFRRLRRDLELFGADFLEGTGEFLQQAALRS